MSRKRKQYEILSYRLYDFDPITGKVRRDGTEINIAENQITELIQAIRDRSYDVEGYNSMRELISLDVSGNISKDILKSRIRNGLYIEGKKYVRLIRSSSMARTGTILFIIKDLFKQVRGLITLGKIDSNTKDVISKLESYIGLATSTTIFIDTVPNNVCIVDSNKFKVQIDEYIKSVKNNEIIQGKYPVPVELFDGQGLHCPKWGKKIARELGLDETPPAYQIRLLPAIKGMSYEIDFKKFYAEHGIEYIEDYKGKQWAVKDLDCIWATSMFKFSKYFNGWGELKELRQKYYDPLGLNQIGISKWSDTEIDPTKKTKMTYQYLQSLALTGADLNNLSSYTRDLVERVYKGDRGETMAYLGLLADTIPIDDDGEEVEDIEDENMMTTKVHFAIYTNPNMIHDPYIQSFLQRQLKKTVNDIKLGRIYIDGQYSFICQDPIMMMEMIGGIEPKGCLNKGEFYSSGATGEYAGFRSPLTHSSEVRKLNFINNPIADKWLNKYKNIVVMNGKDITAQSMGGADFDGDAIFWTNNKTIFNGVIDKFADSSPNYPIVDIFEDEHRAEVKNEAYTIDNIIEYDIRTLDNTIGEVTNIATYFSTLGYKNLKAVDKELVISSLMQNESIDYVKHGIKTISPPDSFRKAKKYKPYYLQRYKYGREGNIQEGVDNAPLNVLCSVIEEWESDLFKQEKIKTNDTTKFIMDTTIINANKAETKRVLKELQEVFEQFKKVSSIIYLKHKNKSENYKKKVYQSFYDNFHAKANQITQDKELLSSLAVYLVYKKDKQNNSSGSYLFPWVCCGEGLIRTIEKTAPETILMPQRVKEPAGWHDADITEFKGKLYQLVEIKNKSKAADFIEYQYKKKIDKELKQGKKTFSYQLPLVGMVGITGQEVADRLADNASVRLDKREYERNGQVLESVGLYQDGDYLASIKPVFSKNMTEDGFIDFNDYIGKDAEIEVLKASNKSLEVNLSLLN